MSKYHIKADGSIGVCKAKEGKCPYTVHIEADTVEQAQREVDYIRYKEKYTEQKQRFGDNATTIDIIMNSDGFDKVARVLPSADDIINSDVDVRSLLRNSSTDVDIRTLLRNSVTDVDTASENIRRNILPKSHFENDDVVVESLSSEELVSRIKNDSDELETMLNHDIPELNKSLDINNYKQKG